VTKQGTAANRDVANKASPQNPRDKADFVIGNMLFVGFHEMGHVLADQFHLPTLGRAEDAADSFATIALLDAGSEFSINVLVQAARGLFLSDRRDRKQGEELDFSDAPGLDRQRAFQIICLMVGSDKEQFKELADWVRMPQDRRRSCAADYDDAKYAWHSLLESHRHADGQPTATIEVAYEAGQGATRQTAKCGTTDSYQRTSHGSASPTMRRPARSTGSQWRWTVLPALCSPRGTNSAPPTQSGIRQGERRAKALNLPVPTSILPFAE
jgi:hypothetical protein